MKKKEYKRIKQIKKKIKDNSRLKAPHLIIKLSKNILKRKSKMPATAITVANRMILKARQDIATHKKQKKKFKNITKDEMKLLTKYHKDLSDTMKTQC
jgi:phosphotransferase system IIA component